MQMHHLAVHGTATRLTLWRSLRPGSLVPGIMRAVSNLTTPSVTGKKMHVDPQGVFVFW